MDKKIARVGSKIKIKFPFEDITLEYIIIPSFDEYTLDSMGGSYYGGHYTIKKTSDADPVLDFTISETSPLAKAILGHRAGDSVTYYLENGVVETVDLIEVIEDREWDEEEFKDNDKKDGMTKREKALNTSYNEWAKMFPDSVVIRKEGYFYSARGQNAIVFSGVMGTNLGNTNGIFIAGHPYEDVIQDRFEESQVNYKIIVSGELRFFKDYENNRYHNYLKRESDENDPGNTGNEKLPEEAEVEIADKYAIAHQIKMF